MNSLRDKTILITGATDGIGKLTAEKLAKTGATLLLHGRNSQKLDIVCKDIKETSGNNRIEKYLADFSSLGDVRKLAKAIAEQHDKIDILINNAGIGFSQNRQTSDDGFELRFAVNFLAPFLLTQLLLPLLRKAARSRIVNVSSAGQHPLDFDDIMLERSYDSRKAYSQSKLALIMFTIELAHRLKPENISVNSLHPGTYLATKMVKEAGISPWGEVETGADAEIYIATSPALEGVTGKYFDVKKEAKALPQAYDENAREKLWRLSEIWTGLKEKASV